MNWKWSHWLFSTFFGRGGGKEKSLWLSTSSGKSLPLPQKVETKLQKHWTFLEGIYSVCGVALQVPALGPEAFWSLWLSYFSLCDMDQTHWNSTIISQWIFQWFFVIIYLSQRGLAEKPLYCCPFHLYSNQCTFVFAIYYALRVQSLWFFSPLPFLERPLVCLQTKHLHEILGLWFACVVITTMFANMRGNK